MFAAREFTPFRPGGSLPGRWPLQRATSAAAGIFATVTAGPGRSGRRWRAPIATTRRPAAHSVPRLAAIIDAGRRQRSTRAPLQGTSHPPIADRAPECCGEHPPCRYSMLDQHSRELHGIRMLGPPSDRHHELPKGSSPYSPPTSATQSETAGGGRRLHEATDRCCYALSRVGMAFSGAFLSGMAEGIPTACDHLDPVLLPAPSRSGSWFHDGVFVALGAS